VHYSRVKHIEINNHFIRDHIVNSDIEILFVSTHDQLADIFKNPLILQFAKVTWYYLF